MNAAQQAAYDACVAKVREIDATLYKLLQSDPAASLVPIATKFNAEITNTGGGIDVVLISAGEHCCIGISNCDATLCWYYSPLHTEPTNIFWGWQDSPDGMNEVIELVDACECGEEVEPNHLCGNCDADYICDIADPHTHGKACRCFGCRS